MTHEELIRSLDSYVDGDLSEAARREVEEHLEVCASCREESHRLGSLLDQATALRNRPSAPSRDLWPEIAGQLSGPARAPMIKKARWGFRWGWTPVLGWAVVTAILLAMVWVAGDPPGVGVHGARNEGDPGRAALSAHLNSLDAQCEATRTQMAEVVQAAPDDSKASGWSVFEQDLDVLDEAIRDSRRALQKDPDNTSLQRSLLMTYQKQLDLLRWAQKVFSQT